MYMKRILTLIFSVIVGYHFGFAQFISYKNTDPRFIENGYELPSEMYADQPYVTVCNDGSWLCTMTTSSGTEGAYMNHIIATKSYDQGKTWTRPVSVEPSGVPQSSWAVPVKVPSGRVYVFYDYNKYKFTGVEGVMSGPFAYKYSDDHGKTWSEERFEVPIRNTKIDEDNYTKGKHQFFWSIDKPIVTEDAAYIAFSKILRLGPDQGEFYARSEGFILKSENILSVANPEDIEWKTLPEGNSGIWNPEFGKVQAEHNIVQMNNGNLYVAYRTWDGFPAYAISDDGGKTFSTPKEMRYGHGALMGNPRACPKIHKTEDGKYLFWFHNNFNKNTYDGRNPAWLSGGIEKDGDIVWSQPEIVLYTRDPAIRGMSYPDYIEQNGQLWIAETQKNVARVHPMDLDLLQGLWNQGKDSIVIEEGKIMDSDENMLTAGMVNFPQLPNLIEGGGFSVELWLTINEMDPGQKVLSTFGMKHKGLEVTLVENNALQITINDGEAREKNIDTERKFVSDQNTLTEGQLHHVVFTLDGAAKVATILIDGIMSDGGDERAYGWGRIYPYLASLNDTYQCRIEDFTGQIHHMRVYNRPLRTSESIANYHAGLDDDPAEGSHSN